MKPKSIALLISTYNWPDALEMCLQSVCQQSVMPSEVIIADDGSRSDTKDLIDRLSLDFKCPVKHIWHEDDGFRKTIILNKALWASDCEYIIQIDGDIIIHPKFIEDHISVCQKGYFIRGTRAILTKKQTDKVLEEKYVNVTLLSLRLRNRWNSIRFPLLSNITSLESHRISNVKGCNIAYWKSDFVLVNGYNNAITGWGHEDIEFASRLYHSGLKMRKVKFKSIAFHLYHKINSRTREGDNLSIFKKNFNENKSYCEDGYEQVKE